MWQFPSDSVAKDRPEAKHAAGSHHFVSEVGLCATYSGSQFWDSLDGKRPQPGEVLSVHKSSMTEASEVIPLSCFQSSGPASAEGQHASVQSRMAPRTN